MDLQYASFFDAPSESVLAAEIASFLRFGGRQLLGNDCQPWLHELLEYLGVDSALEARVEQYESKNLSKKERRRIGV